MKQTKQNSELIDKLIKLERENKSIKREKEHYKSLYYILLNRLQPILELNKAFNLQEAYKILNSEKVIERQKINEMLKKIEKEEPKRNKFVKEFIAYADELRNKK
jgi:hypothetical protein